VAEAVDCDRIERWETLEDNDNDEAETDAAEHETGDRAARSWPLSLSTRILFIWG